MSWPVAPLSSVSKTFADGDWIESKDQSSDGIRLVQTGNVGEGHFKDRRDKARFISPETFDRLNCTEVLPGDVLISRLPDPVGRSCQIPETGDKMITAVDCTIVRPEADKLDQDYLVYYTQSKAYQRDIEDRCTGTTRKRISRKNLGLIPIPLPPLEEQKRIVAVLDQAFAALDRALANAEANLADAASLRAGSIGEVFRGFSVSDCEWTALKEISEIRYGYTAKASHEAEGPKFLRITDIQGGTVNWSDVPSCEIDEASRKKYKLETGDIVFARTGATTGKSYLLRDPPDSVFASYLILLRLNQKLVDPRFVGFYFNSEQYWREVEAGTSGSAQGGFNASKLGAMCIPMPDIALQSLVVETLSEIDAASRSVEQFYTQKLQDLEDLRQSVLQKAFAGQLT